MPDSDEQPPQGRSHDPHSNTGPHPPPKEDANIAACEIYRIAGDIVSMERLGCEDIPEGEHHGPLKTIPVSGGRAHEMDESISSSLKYVMLTLLLLIATFAILACCCQMYSRISSRREILQNAFRARLANTNLSSSYSAKRSGCCGGLAARSMQASTITTNYRPFQPSSIGNCGPALNRGGLCGQPCGQPPPPCDCTVNII